MRVIELTAEHIAKRADLRKQIKDAEHNLDTLRKQLSELRDEVCTLGINEYMDYTDDENYAVVRRRYS